ncbi:oxygenase MpaB family protein [Streptomyces sp. B-S-A8]|uniref:Oxygenase MpaB family protein n=1 Tax=Streptomyces solicavernae TaxID=3043614 RepID=A0ABT6RUJ3_9ACTN|nr:oxygenase MpaB family protein [Streptomyces sp. B-S-A8]MDI3388108.1 oxygenase MpaB family protein [Streptomyces sp. B-S-A8]
MTLTADNVKSEMEAANQAGDPSADALVSDLIDSEQVDGVNGLFRTIGTLKPHQDLSQLPAPLAEFLREAAQEPPDWTEADAAAAEGFFDHHHGVVSMLQGTVGLIGTYLSPTGAFTLRSTGRLGGVEGPGRRLSQSSRLFVDMGNRGALRDGSLAATVTKVRLVHASVRQLHKKSGTWDYAKWGEPVSQKYTTGAACVFSVQILEAMKNLGLTVSREDAHGFLCAWHYVDHYLGTQEKWLLPKDVDEVTRAWQSEREREWAKTDDGVFMTAQAVEFYKRFLPPGIHDAFVAMIRVALTDRYADMAGLPHTVLAEAGKPLAAAHGAFSSTVGGLFGGTAKKAVGVNPYDDVIGIASKAYNEVQRYALTHDQDDQPQMHQELHDNR